MFLDCTMFSDAKAKAKANAKANAEQVEVSLTVTNNGTRTANEVVQLYLGFPASAGEPPLVLAGFTKLQNVKAGAAQEVHFTLETSTASKSKIGNVVSIWNATTHAYEVVHGEFTVYVGASSEDIRATGTFTV